MYYKGTALILHVSLISTVFVDTAFSP